MVRRMRIDTTSLIAAQLAQRPSESAAQRSSDKPLFEPLIFPQAGTETAPSKPHGTATQTPVGRPGAQLDITV